MNVVDVQGGNCDPSVLVLFVVLLGDSFWVFLLKDGAMRDYFPFLDNESVELEAFEREANDVFCQMTCGGERVNQTTDGPSDQNQVFDVSKTPTP